VDPIPVVKAVPAAPQLVPVVSEVPAKVDNLLSQLSNPNEAVRRDAALDLGRMKAQRAVDPLMNMLSKDSSSVVRDAAARALGLIAAPRSLQALIYAAQADNDREVRHSAQFAVEVIRTNLRGN
jgi:HEAT repeat protein